MTSTNISIRLSLNSTCPSLLVFLICLTEAIRSSFSENVPNLVRTFLILTGHSREGTFSCLAMEILISRGQNFGVFRRMVIKVCVRLFVIEMVGHGKVT